MLSLGVDPEGIENLQNLNLKELEHNNIKDASIFQACDFDEEHNITNLVRDLMNAGYEPSSESFMVGIFKALK